MAAERLLLSILAKYCWKYQTVRSFGESRPGAAASAPAFFTMPPMIGLSSSLIASKPAEFSLHEQEKLRWQNQQRAKRPWE